MHLKKVDYYNFFLNIICSILLIIFIRHTSFLLVDIGRDLYFSSAISKGQVFLKDITSLFFPLSYYVNAFFIKIFSDSLNTFYLLGFINSLFFVNISYFIARKFCSGFSSFSLCIAIISTSIATSSIMNFHLPYSWALTYGINTFLLSLFFLIKFYENKKNVYFYLSILLAGIAIAFKYEFILYGLITLFVAIKNKKYFSFLILPLPLILSYLILFFKGAEFYDLIFQLKFIFNMLHNRYSHMLYINCGVIFTFKSLFLSLSYFLFSSVLFFLVFYFLKLKNIFSKIALFLISAAILLAVYFNVIKIYKLFCYISILTAVLFVFNYRKFPTKERIIIISFLSILIKNFWILFINGYGNYFIPLGLLPLTIIFSRFSNPLFKKSYSILLILFSIFIINYNFILASAYVSPVYSKKGLIYTGKYSALNTNKLINFINTNTKKTDKIVVIPLGHMINYLSDRETSGYFNYFTPDFLTNYGEDFVLEKIKEYHPDYFVWSNYDSSSYYNLKYMCVDYGFKICEFINQNYKEIPLNQHKDYIKGDNYIIYKVFKLKKSK